MHTRTGIRLYSHETHGHRVERWRRRQRHARADGFGRGGAATAWAAAALSARARRLRSLSAVRRREAWRRAERDCRCREAAVMWRGGRTTSARRTGRSSSGSRAVTVSVGQRGPVRPARFVARYGWDALGTRPQNQSDGKGLLGRPNSHLAGVLMFS